MESPTPKTPLQVDDEIEGDHRIVEDSGSSTHSLLEYRNPQPSQQPTTIYQKISFTSRIENAFRQWGLSSIYIFFANTIHLIREQGRVAIFQDRFAAALAAILHLPPIAGSIAISWFVYHEYYVGGELAGRPGLDKEKFLGLQFAAKFHELFLVASLSTIVVTMVRHELALGEGVPFGSLSAGLEIASPSFFWSKELCAIIVGNFSTLWKKLLFVATILLCTVLAVAVAPASATALQPVRDFWPAGGTDIWLNSTADQMFPSTLDDTHILGPECALSDSNDECPSSQWQTLSGAFLSQLPGKDQIVSGVMSRAADKFNVRGRHSLMSVYVSVREPAFNTFPDIWSVASAPHVAVADALFMNSVLWDRATKRSTDHNEYRFYYRSNEQYNVPATNPMTFARCQESTYNTNGGVAPLFPDIRSDEFPPVVINDTKVQDWITSIISNTTRPNLFWFDLPANFSEIASLGAVAAIPMDSTNTSFQIWGCMIDARWAGTIVNGDRVSRVSGGVTGGFSGRWMFEGGHRRAKIRPSFAQYLNPKIASSNSTVFEAMAVSVGLWNPLTSQRSSKAAHLETILNLMVVNGMARTAPYTTQHGDIIDFNNDTGPWWRGFMPIPPASFGPGKNAYNVTPEQQASSYKLHMEAFVQGYAYTKSSRAAWFSILVLLTYVGAASIFVVISIVFGFTSSSWESTTELMALALASPAPESIQNTAAGMSTIKSFKERYCVAAEGNRLQLRRWQGTLEEKNRVQPNVVYR